MTTKVISLLAALLVALPLTATADESVTPAPGPEATATAAPASPGGETPGQPSDPGSDTPSISADPSASSGTAESPSAEPSEAPTTAAPGNGENVESPQSDAAAAAPTLQVASSATGSTFYAGVGDYVFTGTSAPGQLTVWWNNPERDDTWAASITTSAKADGTFRVTVPIGPWPATVRWRVTSQSQSLPASAVVTTSIRPPSLTITSSATGSNFLAGVGSYEFAGIAPPGRVRIQWNNPANDSAWHLSMDTTADAKGAFAATAPIGAWPATVKWRIVSLSKPEVPASAPVTTVIRPAASLSVTPSETSTNFLTGVGNYTFTGFAPPGGIQIQWNNPAKDTAWRLSMNATADATGAFAASAPIGGDPATIRWRVISTSQPALPPSAVVTTVIETAPALVIRSSATGELFFAGVGDYVFTGTARPGRVVVQWNNTVDSNWYPSVEATSNENGRFTARVPIGRWPGGVRWRVVTSADEASPAQATTVRAGATLSVTSSTSGNTFVAGEGSYIFAGYSAPGRVLIQWNNPANNDQWGESLTTTADRQGFFSVSTPIGPDAAVIRWRAVSLSQPDVAASPVVITTIQRRNMPYSVRSATLNDLGAAYRTGCPVGPSGLSVITMDHWGFDDATHSGVMIVRNADVSKIVSVFDAAYRQRFPIRKMVNPKEYGANDISMMEDDNTSGFNCRQVVGNPYRMSPHSYGYAVDVNPRENPYYVGGRWYPSSGSAYIDRSTSRPGMHFSGTVFPTEFVRIGGHWGGTYSDYHHFETVPK